MGPGEARKAKAAAEKKKREAGSGSWLDKNVGYGVHDIRRGLAKDCIHCVELVKKRRCVKPFILYPFIYPLYTFITILSRPYIHHIYTRYTPNTPLNALNTP